MEINPTSHVTPSNGTRITNVLNAALKNKEGQEALTGTDFLPLHDDFVRFLLKS